MLKIDIAGLKIDAISKKELLSSLEKRIREKQKTWVTTLYSEFLYAALRDREILDLLNRADIAVADGIAIPWAAKFLQIPLTAKNYYAKIFQAFWQMVYSGAAIIFWPAWVKSIVRDKIPGSDLIWDIADAAAKNNYSIYLLGGFGETAKIVSEKINMHTLLVRGREKSTYGTICGFSDKNPGDSTIIADIQKANPDILLVAFGRLKQEKWISDHMHELPAKLYIGLGGTFDYIAGKAAPPPRFLRQIGLEWLYRLITQPRRIKRIWQATAGLITALIRYKVFMSMPLRKNAVAVVINSENQILVCKRKPEKPELISNNNQIKFKNYWQFPQGGLDGQEIAEGAKRELYEETGITSVKLIKISDKTTSYEWRNAIRKLWKTKLHAKGQIQNIVYFKFLGKDGEINLAAHHTREFDGWQWVRISELKTIIHPERWPIVNIIQEDLKDLS